MHIINSRTVELTDTESVVKDWHNALLDRGYGIIEAADEIIDSVPEGGTTHLTLMDSEFYYWLIGADVDVK